MRRRGPRLQIRVGVNLGPVRLVKDINGNPNIIGDGINVAQRIMSFARSRQILVFALLLRRDGAACRRISPSCSTTRTKTDKHVREHEVYAISRIRAACAAPSPSRRPSRRCGCRRSACRRS